eukprot:g28236.t1
MAIHGLSLKDQVAFVEGLSQVNEDLQFKFKDLKDGFTEVARTFPSLRENFDLEIRSNLVVKLANATMVILNHVRRLKDVKKFQEACKGLSDYQVQELEKLRSLVAGEATPADDKTDEEVLTQELLDMEMPGTPGMSEENEEDLLKRALDTSPVPARKKVLKEHLKDEKRQKKPNKGKVKGPNSKKEQKLMKKPSGKMDKTKKKQANKNPKSTYQRNSLMFMPYKKKGHMAIRLRGVGSLAKKRKLLVSWVLDKGELKDNYREAFLNMEQSTTNRVELGFKTWQQMKTKYGKAEALSRLKAGTIKWRHSPTDGRFMEFWDSDEKVITDKKKSTMLQLHAKGKAIKGEDWLKHDSMLMDDFQLEGLGAVNKKALENMEPELQQFFGENKGKKQKKTDKGEDSSSEESDASFKSAKTKKTKAKNEKWEVMSQVQKAEDKDTLKKKLVSFQAELTKDQAVLTEMVMDLKKDKDSKSEVKEAKEVMAQLEGCLKKLEAAKKNLKKEDCKAVLLNAYKVMDCSPVHSEDEDEEELATPPDSENEEAEENILRQQVDAKEGRVRCSLKVEASVPPKLRVLERGLRELELEATGLTVGCHVQVLKAGDDDQWSAATEMVLASSSSVRFTENTSYRLRLRAQLPIEPLRMKYLRFQGDALEGHEAPQGTGEGGAGAPRGRGRSAQKHGVAPCFRQHTAQPFGLGPPSLTLWSRAMLPFARIAASTARRQCASRFFFHDPSALERRATHQTRTGHARRIASVMEMGRIRSALQSRLGLQAAVEKAAEAMEAAQEVFGIWILNRQKRLFRGVHGNLNPSLWRWYHRHGYWATRRKIIDFGTKRAHRYNQVEGFGKRSEAQVDSSITASQRAGYTKSEMLLDSSVEIQVFGLDGDHFTLTMPDSTTGQELCWRILERLPAKRGVQWPETLKTLNFARDFNQSLSGISWPSSLECLSFGDYFIHPLESLPAFLQELQLGEEFNRSLREVSWPSTLRSLSFGDDFSQSLEGSLDGHGRLPEKLQSLTLGDSFNQSLEAVTWPRGLWSLTFGNSFDQPLGQVSLPSGLQSLRFGDDFDQDLTRVVFPDSLQSLSFGLLFDQSLQQVTWPEGLLCLTLSSAFDQSLYGISLPNSLKSLTFGTGFNQHLEHVALPSSLENLSFGEAFNQNLDTVSLPETLQRLVLGFYFKQSLDFIARLPSLRTLQLGPVHRKLLRGITLPMTLQELHFGDKRSSSLLISTI